MPKYLLPFAAALLLLPTAASAAPAQSGLDSGSTREIIFDKDDNIDGEVLSPGGTQVGGQVAKTHKSMISIRGEFIPQLIQLSTDI